MQPVRITIGGAVYELVYKLPLLDLPQDLLLQILYRCDHVTLCRMATTCRALRDLEAREHAALWKSLLLRHYGDSIFRGVIASSTNLGPLELAKEEFHRDTVEEATLSSLVADRTVAQLNEMYEFYFQIHLYNERKDSPVLVASAVLVPPDGLVDGESEEDFSLETVDGWSTPEGWDHVAYSDTDGVATVKVFAKHKASNTIARIAHIHVDEHGAGAGDFTEVIHPWYFADHGGERAMRESDATPDHGGIPFRSYIFFDSFDEESTEWTKIKFSCFRTWFDPDDEDVDPNIDPWDEGNITPGQFEDELLRSPHLKWHPCKPTEC